jgi:hypothetical protein|tara:strand:- start:387 stop:1007 length:621 start_codon:yes stop_codon:yes gene_type:complete
MKLNKQIILQLIKEEIEKNILQELRSEETDAVAQIVAILTRLDAEKMNTDSVMDEAEKQFQAAQQAANADATPANRDGINEMGCGAPDTNISMGVDHSDDHEGNMAKRQMFKTAEYAAEIFDNIQDGDEFPAWIQSKMTKIADYIGAVKHYLEYDHVMGEKLDKNSTAGEYVDDFRDSDAPQFKGKSKKKKQQMAIAAYLDAKDNK